MDRSDTADAFNELGRAEGFQRGDLTWLSRLCKLRVKNGTARAGPHSLRVRGKNLHIWSLCAGGYTQEQIGALM